MLIRIPLAFVLGLVIYMIAAVMTVYDGALSLIFQPIVGAILTGLALLAVCVLGCPFLIEPVWRRWRRVAWIPALIVLLGMSSCIASWHPALRVKVRDPGTKQTVESFQPAMAVGGWLAAMFGVAFCPLIGFHGDRRWA